jgi:hypothetical protein
MPTKFLYPALLGNRRHARRGCLPDLSLTLYRLHVRRPSLRRASSHKRKEDYATEQEAYAQIAELANPLRPDSEPVLPYPCTYGGTPHWHVGHHRSVDFWIFDPPEFDCAE